MQFTLSRVSLVSTAASVIGVAVVVNAVLLLVDGYIGDAMMRAGLGLYCCILAFVPYDKFLQVARMRVSLQDSIERKAIIALFPSRLLLPIFLSTVLITRGFTLNIASAFR